MIATISTPTYDLDGHVTLNVREEDSDLGQTARRVTRVATLDGGAVVNDFGFSYADKTLVLSWLAEDEALDDNLDRIVRLYNRLYLSSPHGVFFVAPQAFRRQNETSSLTLLVLERLDS
jgi:hypothetical protein